jgi:hypothetical protein
MLHTKLTEGRDAGTNLAPGNEGMLFLKGIVGNLLQWFLYAARFDSQLQVMEDVTMVTL